MKVFLENFGSFFDLSDTKLYRAVHLIKNNRELSNRSKNGLIINLCVKYIEIQAILHNGFSFIFIFTTH